MTTLLQDLSDMEVLALTIFGESRGESIEGQIAVGCVVRNRTIAGGYYKDTCLEPKQFSCWNVDDPNYEMLIGEGQKLFVGDTTDNAILNQCMWISEGIMNHELVDNTNGAKHYLTHQLYNSGKVDWTHGMKISAVIGNHVFLV